MKQLSRVMAVGATVVALSTAEAFMVNKNKYSAATLQTFLDQHTTEVQVDVHLVGSASITKPIRISGRNVSIIGSHDGSSEVSGGGMTRLFIVAENARLALRNLVLRDGRVVYNNSQADGSDGGAAVKVESLAHLTMENCTLVNNTVAITNDIFGGVTGGAVSAVNATVDVVGCHFRNNYAPESYGNYNGTTYINATSGFPCYGGAIYASNSMLRVDATVFSNNTGSHGGAIAVVDGTNFTVTKSNFTDNVMRTIFGGGDSGLGGTKGGAIYALMLGPTAQIEDSNFFRNEAIFGGVLYLTQRSDVVRQETGRGDTAYSSGCPTNLADAVGPPSSLSVLRCHFDSNTARNGNTQQIYSNAAVILLERGVVHFNAIDSSFSNNSAPSGAVFQLQADTSCFDDKGSVYENASAIFTGSTFTNNIATGAGGGVVRGGGVVSVWATNGRLEFHSCNFEGNSACDDCGGGVGKFGSPDVGTEHVNFTLLAINTTFKNNAAGLDGGVITAFQASKFQFEFINTTFSGNTAKRHGGVFYAAKNSSLSFDNCNLVGNFAERRGGALMLEPDAVGAMISGSYTTFSRNKAVLSAAAIYADRVELNLKEWNFDDNISPGSQLELFQTNFSARRIRMSSNYNNMAGAISLASGSSMRCVACEFARFNASRAVLEVSYGTTSSLDDCRFADVDLPYLVATTTTMSLDGTPPPVLAVRNAQLGSGPYAAGLYDATLFVSGKVSMTSCNDIADFGSGGCTNCSPTDFGVACGAYSDAVIDRPRSLASGGSGSLVSLHEKALQKPFINDSLPHFFLSVNATGGDSGGGSKTGAAEAFFWRLTAPAESAWIIHPASGVMVATDTIKVNVTAANSSSVRLGEVEDNFTLSFGVNAINPAFIKTVSTAYYSCPGGSFEIDEDCKSCVSEKDLRGDLRGVNCSTSHGEQLETLPLRHGFWRENSTSTVIFQCFSTKACTPTVKPSIDTSGTIAAVSQGGDISDESGSDSSSSGNQYCKVGHTGPYCAACSDGYALSHIRNLCKECSPATHAAAVSMLAILAGSVVILVVAVIASDTSMDCGPLSPVLDWLISVGNFLADVWGKVPFSKLRTPLITLQILAQYAFICNVSYPNFFETFLFIASIINFDLFGLFSGICMFPNANFYDRLLVTTLAPLFIIGVGGGVLWVCRCRRIRRELREVAAHDNSYSSSRSELHPAVPAPRQSRQTADAMPHGERIATVMVPRQIPPPLTERVQLLPCFVTVAVPVLFLVYSACSTAVFATFSTDTEAEFGKCFLRVDYSIECSGGQPEGTYWWYRLYATIMMAVYPIGTPILFVWQLRHRFRTGNSSGRRAPLPRVSEASATTSLTDDASHSQQPPLQPAFLLPMEPRQGAVAEAVGTRTEARYTEFLWSAYRPKRYYYEVIECARRLLMTGVLVFMSQSSQPAMGTIFASAFTVIYAALKPFGDHDESQTYLTGLAAVWLSVFLSLMLSEDLVDTEGAKASAAASCVMTLALLSWALAIWQVILASRGSIASVSESLHPVRNSMLRRSSEGLSKGSTKARGENQEEKEREAPAWSVEELKLNIVLKY